MADESNDTTQGTENNDYLVTQVIKKKSDGTFDSLIPLGGQAKNIYCQVQLQEGGSKTWISLQKLAENYADFLQNGIFMVASSDRVAPTDTTRNPLWIDYGTWQNYDGINSFPNSD
jgi:hypothetical protein